MIKVLVVDDSPIFREFLSHILGSDPELEVISTASNGKEAIEAIQRKRPDVITMDIHMPVMDGVEATQRIMSTSPIPIIVVSSSSNHDESVTSFNAVKAGALTVLEKPAGPGHEKYNRDVEELIQMIKLMSEVKLVKRKIDYSHIQPPVNTVEALANETNSHFVTDRVKLVAMGTSTGGPQTLHAILTAFPADFPVPIVIVQHISSGFLQGLVEWLARNCKLPIHIAQNGELLQPGNVYFAPDGLQMGIRYEGIIKLTADAPKNGHIPSVSYLFQNLAEVYGCNAMGVLLTGMGKDGADGLKQMKGQGAFTIVQDEKSSIIYGMPAEAIKLGAASCILGVEEIATKIISVVYQQKRGVTEIM